MRLRTLQRLKVSDREDPFAAIIRCTADPAKADKRTRSPGSAVRSGVQAAVRGAGSVHQAQGRDQRLCRSVRPECRLLCETRQSLFTEGRESSCD
jgi:hypothetical protein